MDHSRIIELAGINEEPDEYGYDPEASEAEAMRDQQIEAKTKEVFERLGLEFARRNAVYIENGSVSVAVFVPAEGIPFAILLKLFSSGLGESYSIEAASDSVVAIQFKLKA
jgi:hypothetical protein